VVHRKITSISEGTLSKGCSGRRDSFQPVSLSASKLLQ
jgi:hypothetical protein